MARIILITGGCRSGKSGYAQELAESLPGRRVYVATCPVQDDEMRRRVEAHRRLRANKDWETIEQPLGIIQTLRETDHDVLLIDCLTLWVSNLMYQNEQDGKEVSESDVEQHAMDLIDACRSRPGTVVMVTNEVGMGIVPDNALARRYRDLIGRLNQTIASAADDVTFVACGLPIHLKES